MKNEKYLSAEGALYVVAGNGLIALGVNCGEATQLRESDLFPLVWGGLGGRCMRSLHTSLYIQPTTLLSMQVAEILSDLTSLRVCVRLLPSVL